jgi:hypothetical protein
MRLHDERAEWKLVFAAAFVSSFGMVAAAQTPERIPLLRDISPEVITIAVYYKETVHDPADQRIGRIVDLVIKPDRTVPAAIVSVGGFSASHQNMSRLLFLRCRSRRRSASPTSFWIRTRSC